MFIHEKEDVWDFQTRVQIQLLVGALELLMEFSRFYMTGNIEFLNACIQQNSVARQYEHAFVLLPSTLMYIDTWIHLRQYWSTCDTISFPSIQCEVLFILEHAVLQN